MRHFPKERGRSLKGTGEWDVMGLPFPSLDEPVVPEKGKQRQRPPDMTQCKRLPPEGIEVIWIKGMRWKYKYTMDAKKFKRGQIQQSNAKRKMKMLYIGKNGTRQQEIYHRYQLIWRLRTVGIDMTMDHQYGNAFVVLYSRGMGLVVV
jgi:hypothetical protein